jgi:hypothetical protein
LFEEEEEEEEEEVGRTNYCTHSYVTSALVTYVFIMVRV